MNTKNFLLLVFFLLMQYTMFAYSRTQKVTMDPVATSGTHQTHQTETSNTNWDVNIPADTQHLGHQHHGEEDGRHHEFHLDRVRNTRKGKKISCFICQLIIALMHLSLLLCLFQKTISWILG